MAKEREYIEYVMQVQGENNLKKLGSIVDNLMKQAEEAGVSVDDFAKSLKELGETPKKDLPIYDQFIDKMKTIASITAVGVGIKKSIDIFTSFDDIARKVQATTGATAEDMELLRYQAKELGRTTSWSASQAGEAQFEFAKAGFNNNQILAAMPGILNTATVAQIGLGEAASITAGTLRMFRLDASKANLVGDILSKTANSTSTDVHGLGESLKYAGKDAHDFKLSLEQTAAILGSLGNEMLQDSQAGTGLQSVFSAFKDKNKAKILIEAGINLSEDGEYRNFLDILKDIRKQANNLSEIETKSLINSVFGEQGSRVINRLLGQSEEELENLIKTLENAEGSAEESVKIFEGGLGGAFRGLSSASEGFGISIGDYLEPTIISLVNGLTTLVNVGTGAIDWLNSGSYAADTLSFAVAALCVGYGTYKSMLVATTLWEKAHTVAIKGKNIAMAAGKAITTILTAGYTAYMGVLGLLTGQISITTAVTWGLNAAMMILTGPISLIAAVVVGAGAGFYFLYQKSERFRNAIAPLINSLKELWNWIKKFDLVSGAINIAKSGIGAIKNIFTAGTQGKTKKELEEEINKKTKEVASGTGKSNEEVKTGTGENTDYLLLGTAEKKTNNYKHNGYYLKGTDVNNNIYNNSNSSYSNDNLYNRSTEEKVPEKTIEEKIFETLIMIKDLLKGNTTESSSPKIEFNIYKSNKEEIMTEVVKDLLIALENQ